MDKPTHSITEAATTRSTSSQPPCKRNLLHDPHLCRCADPCPSMNDHGYLVQFFNTENPSLASYLEYLNFKRVILRPAHGTRPLFEFFDSPELLTAVEEFEKGNGGFKRLLGIHSRMTAIAESMSLQIEQEADNGD